MGLFNLLSSGVIDIFYEPYQGFVLNDRPQELGIGIAKGGLSFVKKSVFGFSDSISKVTGSIAKGLSVATMDKLFQERRRLNTRRNRPNTHCMGSLLVLILSIRCLQVLREWPQLLLKGQIVMALQDFSRG